MAKRTQRHGVSGNPARRAQAAGGASASSPARAQRRLHTYVLGAALVVVVLLVLFVPRPGGEGPTGPAPDVAPPGETTPAARAEVQTTGAPRRATDEAFCDAFVAMVNSEGQPPGERETRTERLEQLADELLAVGVPATMSLPARTGYYEVMSDVYDHIGLELAPEAVGAASLSIEGAGAAFTAYLDKNCPV